MKFSKLPIHVILVALAIPFTVVVASDNVVKAQATSFKPMVVKVALGDTVSWKAMSGHTTETVDGMIPGDADGWKSSVGEAFTTPELNVEGVYFYKCGPHWGAGMGGVIIVGNPTNLSSIEALKPKGAAKRLLKKTRKALR